MKLLFTIITTLSLSCAFSKDALFQNRSNDIHSSPPKTSFQIDNSYSYFLTKNNIDKVRKEINSYYPDRIFSDTELKGLISETLKERTIKLLKELSKVISNSCESNSSLCDKIEIEKISLSLQTKTNELISSSKGKPDRSITDSISKVIDSDWQELQDERVKQGNTPLTKYQLNNKIFEMKPRFKSMLSGEDIDSNLNSVSENLFKSTQATIFNPLIKSHIVNAFKESIDAIGSKSWSPKGLFNQ